jgi:trehalose 6-phosphate synthase/phosphatase
MVTMSNVSIEPQMVSAALALPSVEQTRRQLNEKHAGRIIIAGCDIGQRLQGVALKLLAFERLLKGYPPWQSKVVMVQRLLLPGSRKDDEAQTVRELRFLVKRIKHTFGDAVIDYQELQGSSLPMDQRLALWKAADVMMVTPIREGLNHWPMEYIFAHKEPATPGVVIASEFSAVSSILNGALRVNPYDIKMTVTTIDKALTMDRKEREGRRYRDIDFVSTSPSDKWTKNVLRDLKDAMTMQTGSESQSASFSSTPSMIMGAKNILIDSTATYLARESGLALSRLNHSAVKQA